MGACFPADRPIPAPTRDVREHPGSVLCCPAFAVLQPSAEEGVAQGPRLPAAQAGVRVMTSLAKATAHFEAERYDDAIRELNALLEQEPSIERGWRLLGACYFARVEPRSAGQAPDGGMSRRPSVLAD